MRSGAMPGKRADTTAVRMTMIGVFALREIRIEADPGDQQADHGGDGEAGPRQTKSGEEIHGASSSGGSSFTF